MSIWASHIQIKDGELLSSWLVRLGSEFGMTALQFCAEILALGSTNLNEIDRSPSDALLHALTKGTDISIERLRQASLLDEEGYLFTENGTGATRWIIPLLTPHRISQGNPKGMSYCPQCFSSDEQPYYRKYWRYAFYAVCPAHHAQLVTTCPHCGKAYGYTQPVARQKAAIVAPITTCWSCGRDIRKSDDIKLIDENLTRPALSIQEDIIEGIRIGKFDTPSHGLVNSRIYLDVLYNLVKSISPANEAERRTLYWIADQSGINLPKFPWYLFAKNDFENLEPENRAILLRLAKWLIGDWPSRIASYAKETNLSHRAIFYGIEDSYWLAHIPYPINFDQPVKCIPSKDEVNNAEALLRKILGRAVRKGELLDFMAKGYLDNERQRKLGESRKASLEYHERFSKSWGKSRAVAKRKNISRIIRCRESKKFLGD